MESLNYNELFEPFDERLFKCQWKECRNTFDDFAYFFSHCRREHSSDYVDIETVCGWRGCKQFGFESADQLYTHLTVHIYYHNLMIEGYKVLKNVGFDKAMCFHGIEGRCDVSLFSPGGFLCGWKDCETKFNDYNLFVQHTGYHAIEDVTIPLIAKEKLRKIRYAKCLWFNCDKDFKTKTHLKTHLLSHSWGKNYACPVCGFGFTNKAQFLNHCYRQKVSVSVEKSPKSSKRSNNDDGDEEDDDNTDHQQKKQAADKDRALNNDDSCQNNGDRFSCQYCPKVFDTQNLYSLHLAGHERKHPCPECDYVAPYPSNLQAHIKYKHTKEREFGCRFCPAKFKTSYDLVRHVHLHSNPQAVNVCDICNKSYTTLYSLKRHKAEHMNVAEKTSIKYRCEVCKENFESLDSIKEHLSSAACTSNAQTSA